MPRRAVVLVVKQRDFPRALFVARGQAGGEAVQRDDHARFNPFNQLAQFIVIGPMKQVQPRFHIRADIAGDQMPVAFRRDHGCIVFRAMEIADQPADAGDMRGDIVAAGQPVGDAFHPDIDCDVFFQKARIDAQLVRRALLPDPRNNIAARPLQAGRSSRCAAVSAFASLTFSRLSVFFFTVTKF